MIDFVLGIFFAGLFVRGWLRGFVKEFMDFVGLLVGAFVAFRFSEQLGEVFASMSQTSPTVARYAAGVALFLIVGALVSVAAHYLGKIASKPGFKLSNRVFGAFVATLWGWILATVVVLLLAIFPLPQAAADSFDESVIVGVITDSDGMTQKTVARAAGDRTFSQVLALQRIFGNDPVILQPGESLAIEEAEADELSLAPDAGQEIFALLNESRIEAGFPPLAWSDALAQVGNGHANDMYLNGFFSHTSSTTGTIGNRASAAGLTYSIVGENLALAADSVQIHEGLMGSSSHRDNILRASFRRVGIGVVEGPAGLMVVQVFSG